MRRGGGILFLGLILGGCLPYTAGTTARTTPPNEVRASTALYAVPNGLQFDSTFAGERSYLAVDAMARIGLSERADLGLRVPGGVGFILDYKRRVLGAPNEGPALALMGGAGVINAGQHAHVEATVLASGAPEPTVTPYGGVRTMHVVPLSESAVSDQPTVGGFVGLRIGTAELGVSPEVGVYYDEPALDVSSRRIYVIPSVTLHGSRLLSIFF